MEIGANVIGRMRIFEQRLQCLGLGHIANNYVATHHFQVPRLLFISRQSTNVPSFAAGPYDSLPGLTVGSGDCERRHRIDSSLS